MLLRELPFRDPGRLVVWEANPAPGGFIAERVPVCLTNYLAWKAESRSFSGMGVFEEDAVTVLGGDKPERIAAGRVSTDFFGVLGVGAQIGRTFTASEGDPGNAGVVVLGHALFERRFGGDPRVLGSAMRLNGQEHAIIGVMPAVFHLPAFWEGMEQKKPELWVPLNTSPNQRRADLTVRNKYVFARLQTGLGQARAEMKLIAHRLETQHPDVDKTSFRWIGKTWGQACAAMFWRCSSRSDLFC